MHLLINNSGHKQNIEYVRQAMYAAEQRAAEYGAATIWCDFGDTVPDEKRPRIACGIVVALPNGSYGTADAVAWCGDIPANNHTKAGAVSAAVGKEARSLFDKRCSMEAKQEGRKWLVKRASTLLQSVRNGHGEPTVHGAE